MSRSQSIAKLRGVYSNSEARLYRVAKPEMNVGKCLENVHNDKSLRLTLKHYRFIFGHTRLTHMLDRRPLQIAAADYVTQLVFGDECALC